MSRRPTAKCRHRARGNAGTRAALASDLQRELKRVGCYGGEITGTWTPSSKKAMSAFMERVNATLPVEEPDYILLTLVQGHAATACGADCPSGQVLSGAGRCVPQAVVAQASRKTLREDERRATEERKAQQQERLALEQRTAEAKRLADASKSADAARVEALRVAQAQSVALAQKAADAQRVAAATVVPPAPKAAVRPPVQKSDPQRSGQQTAAVEPERLPWLADDAATAAPSTGATTTRAVPLPGMMSVGGPRIVAPETPANIMAVAPGRGSRPAVVIEDLLDTKVIETKTAAVSPPADAAAVVTAPAASRAVQAGPRLPAAVRQAVSPGLPGTKSGVTVHRPVVRQAAIAGLPGTKSGVAGMPGTKSGIAAHSVVRNPPTVTKYRAAKIIRRPPPVVVYTPKPKSYSYASSSGGKSRRGQPRPGSMQYNVMHSLGGIY